MTGLIRTCREGDSFKVGDAVVRVVKAGRALRINIVAPPHVVIEHIGGKCGTRSAECGTKETRGSGDTGTR